MGESSAVTFSIVDAGSAEAGFALGQYFDELDRGAIQWIDEVTAEIKRMWVDSARRGIGLGTRLLRHLEGHARSSGRSRVVLDTNESLAEAISMYHNLGYEPIERYNDNPYAHHWFAKALEPGEPDNG